MNKEQIMSIVETLKGGKFHSVATHKKVALAKKWDGYNLETESEMVVQIGCDYANTYGGREKVLNGEEIEKPNGKTWVLFPFVLQSDKDPNKYYLRTYSVPNAKHSKRFILNGEETTREHLAEIGLPKSTYESRPFDPSNPIDLTVESIVSIN